MTRPPGTVLLEIDNALAVLTLHRPGAANAVSLEMVEALESCVATLEASSCAGLILTGSGGRFCAGSDLAAVRAGVADRAGALRLCARMAALTARLEALPMLRVAAVEGAALGGGAELMLVGHRVVAARGAQVGFVQAALGLTPGWGGARRLADRVGPRRATLLLAEARRLSASEAQSSGLVDEVVDEGQALAAARSWLVGLPAWGAPEVLRNLALLLAPGGLALEQARFGELWGGPAHRAALAQVPQGRR